MSNRVRERRQELGLTQDELAIKSGLSRQTIINVECESSNAINTSTLTKIANALDSSVGFLFFSETV